MKKLLLLTTIFVVAGLIVGCAALDVMDVVGIESDILSPKMEERRRRKTERIYQRGLTLCVQDPEGDPRWEPDGFRGIKFGTDISALENMEFMRERIIRDVEGKEWKTEVYVRKNEIMRIEDIPVDRIEYFFHEGKFCYVELVARKPRGASGWIVDSCVSRFGHPSCQDIGDHKAWVWKKTIVETRDVTEESIESGDLWEKEKKASFDKVKKDATWEETKFMYKGGIDYDPQTRSLILDKTIRLRIMTKEAAEHLGYRVKVVEKK